MVVAVAKAARGRRATPSSAPRPATRRRRRRPTRPRPGMEVDRRPAEGPDRHRQAPPGADRRRAGRRDRRQLRPGARDRPRARRTGRPPGDPRQLRQPVPPRGAEDRRVRDLRRARPRAGRAWPSRSATPATSARTGWASATTRRPGWSPGRRGCGASRRPAPRRSSAAAGWTIRRPSRPRSGSATRRRGTWPSRPATSSAAAIDAVTDDEILAAYRDLARLEGIFCEPASAAGVAGVRKAAAAGELDPDAHRRRAC